MREREFGGCIPEQDAELGVIESIVLPTEFAADLGLAVACSDRGSGLIRTQRDQHRAHPLT